MICETGTEENSHLKNKAIRKCMHIVYRKESSHGLLRDRQGSTYCFIKKGGLHAWDLYRIV